jgi:ribosomal protein S2
LIPIPTQLLVKYPIPANDDAIKALQLITDYLVTAINNGKASTKKVADKTETKTKEPTVVLG